MRDLFLELTNERLVRYFGESAPSFDGSADRELLESVNRELDRFDDLERNVRRLGGASRFYAMCVTSEVAPLPKTT